jgi:hypothetical protein
MIVRPPTFALIALLTGSFASQSASAATDVPEVRFVVLGHIRGNVDGGLNPKLRDLLGEVHALAPAFVVLTGDIIWGDYESWPPDRERVTRQWNEVDEVLGSLKVPIYRVPGNHDVSDAGTREIWRQRYGPIPQAVSVAGIRLLLLSSVYIRDNQASDLVVRGVDLDPEQVRWLDAELARPSDVPTFAFLHHLLWWEPDNGRWWTEVHPLLAHGGVKAVFSGDYGPLKFSTTERGGVKYYQTSMETPVSLATLQRLESSRLLSAQFDNYLEVVVRGREPDIRVHTIGEVSSGEFTPERYNAIAGGVQFPRPSAWRRLTNFIGSPRRIAALMIGGVFAFATGWWFGRRRHRRGFASVPQTGLHTRS